MLKENKEPSYLDTDEMFVKVNRGFNKSILLSATIGALTWYLSGYLGLGLTVGSTLGIIWLYVTADKLSKSDLDTDREIGELITKVSGIYVPLLFIGVLLLLRGKLGL